MHERLIEVATKPFSISIYQFIECRIIAHDFRARPRPGGSRQSRHFSLGLCGNTSLLLNSERICHSGGDQSSHQACKGVS